MLSHSDTTEGSLAQDISLAIYNWYRRKLLPYTVWESQGKSKIVTCAWSMTGVFGGIDADRDLRPMPLERSVDNKSEKAICAHLSVAICAPRNLCLSNCCATLAGARSRPTRRLGRAQSRTEAEQHLERMSMSRRSASGPSGPLVAVDGGLA